MSKPYNPDLICRVCNQTWSNVVHCKECCGWGVTKDIQYHEFQYPYTKHKARTK